MGRNYSADDIVRDINDGKKEDAAAHLNYDYLHMSPNEFKSLVEDVQKKTSGDSNGWNNVYSTTDKDTVTAVYIDDGVLWDTKLFDKKDAKGNVTDPFGAIKRLGLGGLDQGKKD